MPCPLAHAAAAVLVAFAAGCGSLPPSRTWLPTADLATTQPPSRAEGGQAPRVEAPAGVSWTTRLDGYEAVDGALPRLEFTLTLSDAAVPRGAWRLTPLAEYCELVDDEGRRFRCTSALVPDAPGSRARATAEPAFEQFTLVFPLPLGYRLRAVTSIALHWRLRVGEAETLAVTTLFRA